MKRILEASVLASALVMATGALAQQDPRPQGGPGRGAGKAAAAEKRAEAAEKRAEAADKREAAAEKRAEAAEGRGDPKAAPAALKAAWAKLKETRKERRQERIAAIKKQWGELHARPAVRAELKVHAWRMARLNRMRALAQAEGKDAVVARIDKLIEKEKARHQKHMETLKSKGDAK